MQILLCHEVHLCLSSSHINEPTSTQQRIQQYFNALYLMLFTGPRCTLLTSWLNISAQTSHSLTMRKATCVSQFVISDRESITCLSPWLRPQSIELTLQLVFFQNIISFPLSAPTRTLVTFASCCGGLLPHQHLPSGPYHFKFPEYDGVMRPFDGFLFPHKESQISLQAGCPEKTIVWCSPISQHAHCLL